MAYASRDSKTTSNVDTMAADDQKTYLEMKNSNLRL